LGILAWLRNYKVQRLNHTAKLDTGYNMRVKEAQASQQEKLDVQSNDQHWIICGRAHYCYRHPGNRRPSTRPKGGRPMICETISYPVCVVCRTAIAREPGEYTNDGRGPMHAACLPQRHGPILNN